MTIHNENDVQTLVNKMKKVDEPEQKSNKKKYKP